MKKIQKLQSYSPEQVAAAWKKERPDLDHLGLGVTIRIRALAMLIDQHIAGYAERLDITQGDLMLLYAMRRSGHPYCMRPTDIFRLLSVTSGAATYRTDKLVEKGLAMRIADPQDRRSNLIQLTEKGINSVDWAITALAEDSNSCLKHTGIRSADVLTLCTLLTKVEQGWLAATPAESNPLARSEKTKETKPPKSY